MSVLILVAAIGLVGFLILASSANFKDQLFAALYQKQSSFAAGETVPDEILVKFDKSVSSADQTKIKAALGQVSTAETIPSIGVEGWRVDVNKRDEILNSLNNNPFILYAEPNFMTAQGSTASATAKTSVDEANLVIDAANKNMKAITVTSTSEYSNTLQDAINFASNKGVKVEKSN